jgi:hypothetical protein
VPCGLCWNGLAQLLSLCASDVGDVGVDEVLFGEGFVEQVLDCSVQVAVVVGSHDFLCELGKQGGWNLVESQVHEEVVLGGEDYCFLFHVNSLWAPAYGLFG